MLAAKTILFASLAGFAVAQTSTTTAAASGSTCAGQVVLDACMGTIQAQVNSCSYTDYACLCSAYTSMVGCYASAGCPNQAGVGTAKQQQELNCNNASVYSSLSAATATTKAASASSVVASATSAASAAVSSAHSSASSAASNASASASATGSSSKNGAQSVKTAGGLLAIVAAGVCAVL